MGARLWLVRLSSFEIGRALCIMPKQAFKNIYFAKKEAENPKFATLVAEQGRDKIWLQQSPHLRFGKFDPDTREGDEEAFKALLMWEKEYVCTHDACSLLSNR